MRQGEGADGGSEWGISTVNKIVKIAGHSSLESVHHYLHLLFYRLYLRDNRGRVASMRDGRLTFCRSNLLGALLPSGPSRSHLSALVSSRSSSRISCPIFRHSCSSKTWFCLVRHSTATVRICTCFLRAVGHGLSSWTLLVVTIDRVSTMQLFFREALAVTYDTTYRSPQTAPTDDARKSTVSYTVNTCSQWHLHNTKRMDLTKSTVVVPTKYPPKVKLELLTTLEC